MMFPTIDIIDWQSLSLRCTDLCDAVITELVKHDESTIVYFPRLPSHTQVVERCVKFVTQASASVCGQTSRDGFIRSRLEGDV